MIKINDPFPDGNLNHELVRKGWREHDILEIREILLKEIRRQNENGDPEGI